MLGAALGGHAAYAGRFVKFYRDHGGDHAHRAFAADYGGNRVFIHAVLQRHRVTVLRQIRRHRFSYAFGVVRLDRDENDVKRLLPGQRGEVVVMERFRLIDREFFFVGNTIEFQPARADSLDILRPQINQRHILPAVCKIATDIAAQRAGAHKRNVFSHVSSLKLVMHYKFN